MTRKILTLVFVLGLLFGSLGVQPAEALTTYTAWTGSGPGAIAFTNAAGSHHQFDYGINPAGLGSSRTWNYHTTANTDGTVTLSYNYSGLHAWYFVTVFLKAYVKHNGVTTYYPLINAGPAICCTSPSNGFAYSGSLDLNVKAGDEYGFEFGGSNSDGNNFLQGRLVVDTSGLYEPPQYTMWLLTRNDGTYCLLKSDTHPSVDAQNHFCFPEETGNTWVADNVACFGEVDWNDFWSCAEEYGIWQGLGK